MGKGSITTRDLLSTIAPTLAFMALIIALDKLRPQTLIGWVGIISIGLVVMMAGVRER